MRRRFTLLLYRAQVLKRGSALLFIPGLTGSEQYEAGLALTAILYNPAKP